MAPRRLLRLAMTTVGSLLLVLPAVHRGWSERTAAPVSALGRLTRLPVNLHGISFLTPEEGWVVGQLGKIFHSTDGGRTWEEQPSGTDFLLTAVSFVDRLHGWAVGEQGIILHSADGGATWRPQQSGVSYPLFDIHFLDQETGWVVGHWGTILRTADGGQRWTERSLSRDLEGQQGLEPAALHDVIDPKTGEVVAKAGQLLAKEQLTEITHRHISEVRVREDVVLNAVFFVDPVHGWIVGERGLILRTADRGESWERTVLPRPPGAGEEEIAEEMGEAELEALGVVAPSPSLYGVFFVSPLEGWVVGQEGTVAWTQDGGRSWELQPSNVQEPLYDVGVVGNTGWIVGDKGTVLMSTDGGKRWEKEDLDLEYRLSWLRRLALVPGNQAFLAGAGGLVLFSGLSVEQGTWIQNPGEQ